MANKVYQIITDRIISEIEKNGALPWHKPWQGGQAGDPVNIASKRPYRGVNRLLLGITPYSCNIWGTIRQINAAGGQVRKGEKGWPVVFYKVYSKGAGTYDDQGKEIEERRFVLRYYTVFNLEQQQGVSLPETAPAAGPDVEPIEAAESLIEGYLSTGPTLVHAGGQAFYRPSTDTITLPARQLFNSSAEYYSTLYHEAVHSTGHESRQGRFSGGHSARHEYSFEELIAEIGCCFLCSTAGILDSTFYNSAAYISGWLKALQDNPTWIVKASNKAEKAVDLITGNTAEKQAEKAA